TMEEEKKIQSRLAFAWIALAVVSAPLLWHFLTTPRIAERSPRVAAVNQVKQLVLACRAYAADHEGPYPPTLGALYPDYIDDLDHLFAIDEKGRKRILIYHPGFRDTDNPRPILIEHPNRFGTKRIAGYVG